MVRKILHLEVGGSYGGSIKALELYLRCADRERFDSRVLFYYPTPDIESLRREADVSVLFKARPNTPVGPLVRPLLPLVRRPSQLVNDVRFLVREMPKVYRLAKVMRSGRFDVVHVNNTFTYQPASILAAARVGIPVVAHVRNPVKLSGVSKALARRVDCFVAVNQTLADSLKGYPIRHIRDAIEPKRPRPEAIVEMRRMFGGEGLIVGSVGRLDEQKGYEYLIRAAHIVHGTLPNVTFVVAGDGPLRADLQSLIDSLGLSSRFRLLGFRTDAEVVISAFDLYVCSSLWEGLPLTVLEAIALTVPVISTAIGGIPEVINNAEGGWLVKPGDAEDLARAIIDASSISAKARCQVAVLAKSAVAPFQDLKGLAQQFEALL